MTDDEQRYLVEAWERGDTVPAIAKVLRTDKSGVTRWRKKLNLPSREEPLRSPPTYFRRDVVEEHMSVRALRKKYKTSSKTLHRWESELGVKLDNYNPPSLRKRPVPDDWYQVAPTKTIKELRDEYGLSDSLVRKMVRETGVKVIRLRSPLGQMGRGKALSTQPHTELDAAAHHLRRYYACVHRCDIRLYSENDPARRHITWGAVRGLENGGAGFYFVDSVGIVANDDVVALARSKGWRSSYD